MEKNIGIIILANGPYKIFIDTLIDSVREKFILNRKKQFFIITDGEFNNQHSDDCKVYYKERKGWPLDCLLRSEYVLEIKDDLVDCEYSYFMGASLFINSEINEEEMIPDESGLIAVEHTAFVHRNTNTYTYDRNPNSTANIPFGEGTVYYQAVLWGGLTESLLKMSEIVAFNTKIDIDNGVEALWLDESHVNRYFVNNPPKTLPTIYAWPEIYPIIETPKIIQLEKRKYLEGNFRYLDPSQTGSGTY